MTIRHLSYSGLNRQLDLPHHFASQFQPRKVMSGILMASGMATPKRALFIGAIFFLVTATINVSLLPVHSTTSCPSSTTDFFGISLEKNSFKSNSYFIRQSTTIWLTKRLLVIAKVRRTQRACALYCNSTLTFRPLLKLIFDIELNPGPNGSNIPRDLENSRNHTYSQTRQSRTS